MEHINVFTMHPKKAVLAATLLLIGTSTLHAQRSGLGLKGGAMISRMDSEVLRSNWLPGALIGAYAPIGLGARLEVQPELLVAAMGSRFEGSDGSNSQVRTLSMLMPISVKWFMGNTFNLQGGVQTGLLLLAEQQAGDERLNTTANYNSIDFGFNLGLGIDMRYGWDLGLRYYNGMTPVLREDDRFYPKNQAAQITAGYRMVQLKRSRTVRKRY